MREVEVNAEVQSSSDLNSCLLIQHNFLFMCIIVLRFVGHVYVAFEIISLYGVAIELS